MSWFRRQWTAQDAEEWTKEDYWTLLFSALSYVFLSIGVGLCFLLPVWGIPCTLLGILCAGIMYWIIDPKLRAISEEYEKKQKEYLEHLEKIMKWEET